MSGWFKTKDPFTLAYDVIWELLESSKEFKALCKEGNRIKFAGDDILPAKSKKQDADTPEVMLVPSGGVSKISITNKSAEFTRTFNLQIQSTNYNASKHIFPLEWVIIKIFGKAASNLGREYIVSALLGASTSEFGHLEGLKNKLGWSTAFDIEVRIVVDRLNDFQVT